MHFTFPSTPVDAPPLRLCCLATIAFCLLFVGAACGGGEQAQQTSSETGTPMGPAPPRTTFPMPPVATSGNASTNAQSFTLLGPQEVSTSSINILTHPLWKPKGLHVIYCY